MREADHGRPLRIAIIGSGNIGTDLLLKVERSELLSCHLMVGRRKDSPGLKRAMDRGVSVSAGGIEEMLEMIDELDVVFDATSAADAFLHWERIEPTGTTFIDLTPAHMGTFCIPALNLKETRDSQYLSMVTCGGQAAVPLASAVAELVDSVSYIELVSTSSSMSVGPASRANLDEYLLTTEDALAKFCPGAAPKTILVINPAETGVVMRNTLSFRSEIPFDIHQLQSRIADVVTDVQRYVPGYRLTVPPSRDGEKIVMTVEVEGSGDWLPKHAGNLDIITCAAVAAAEIRANGNHNELV